MNNTKRIFSLILSVALAMCVIVALSSCNPIDTVKGWFGLGECEHTFSEEWASDAENHWHAATCEHAEEKSELAAHADANKDGKCDTCEYTMSSGTGTNTKPTPPKPENFTVTVVNADGAPVQGVKVTIVDKDGDPWGDAAAAKLTDAEGKVVFNVLVKNGWLAQIIEAPAGYASETVSELVAGADTEDTADDVYLDFVKKYEFDEAHNVTITLVNAPVEDNTQTPPVENNTQTPPVEGGDAQ